MTTSTLPDITEVRPVDASDLPCLNELRDVLERHGALERFGLNLLHDHFELDDDELLVEVSDADTRTLTIRPVREDAEHGRGGRFVETNFQFVAASSGTETVAYKLVCKVGCFVDLKDKHSKTHDSVWG
jgi:hypothetical protein